MYDQTSPNPDFGRVDLLDGRRSVLAWVLARAPIADGYRPRNLGSSTSRMASPIRLKPKTTKLRARPGKIAIHGACVKKRRACPLRSAPQDGVGGGVPRP